MDLQALDAANRPLLAVGLGLVILALLATLVLLGRTRRRRDPEQALPRLSEQETSVAFATKADADEATEATEATEEPEESEGYVSVRALRAQVRVLEQALEASDTRAALEPVPQAGPVATVPSGQLESYRRQVHLALRAVAVRTGPDEDPRHTIARAVAAVERLDAYPDSAPILPEPIGYVAPVGSGSQRAPHMVAVSSMAAPAAAPAPPVPAALTVSAATVPPAPVVPPAPEVPDEPLPAAQLPAVEPQPQAQPQAQPEAQPEAQPQPQAQAQPEAQPQPQAQPEPEVVVPVPPPAPAAAPRRGRRRLRGTAA